MPHLNSSTPVDAPKNHNNDITDVIPDKTEIRNVKKIGESKFPVFLTYSEIHNTYYALKSFPLKSRSKQDPCYVNQARFSGLHHKNIINIIDKEPCMKVIQDGEVKYVSYILMDYAPNGTFNEAYKKIIEAGSNEKLVRTYFKQLISGLEYIHS